MLTKDIVIGDYYRHKTNPHYCWAQAIKVLKPKEGENTTSSIVVKCRWMHDKDDTFSFVKYFKPSDLIKNVVMQRVGKKKAGLMLDGREWNEVPE